MSANVASRRRDGRPRRGRRQLSIPNRRYPTKSKTAATERPPKMRHPMIHPLRGHHHHHHHHHPSHSSWDTTSLGGHDPSSPFQPALDSTQHLGFSVAGNNTIVFWVKFLFGNGDSGSYWASELPRACFSFSFFAFDIPHFALILGFFCWLSLVACDPGREKKLQKTQTSHDSRPRQRFHHPVRWRRTKPSHACFP